MSNVGKRGKVSLRVRLRDALMKGTNSTIRNHEIREVIDALSKPPAREDAQPWGYGFRRKSWGDAWSFSRHKEQADDILGYSDGEVQPLYTHPAPDALREFAKHPNLELSYRYADEDDDGAWLVHRVNGGRNDREWTQIGSGDTPEAAIAEALAALQAEQKGGA